MAGVGRGARWGRLALVIGALIRISGPGDGATESCGPGCTTLYDGGAYRLIWQPLAGR